MLIKVKFKTYRNRINYKWFWTPNLLYVKLYITRDLILMGVAQPFIYSQTNFVNFMTCIMGGIIYF